jgi:hypothetical protein
VSPATGTEGSKPSLSSGESRANLTSHHRDSPLQRRPDFLDKIDSAGGEGIEQRGVADLWLRVATVETARRCRPDACLGDEPTSPRPAVSTEELIGSCTASRGVVTVTRCRSYRASVPAWLRECRRRALSLSASPDLRRAAAEDVFAQGQDHRLSKAGVFDVRCSAMRHRAVSPIGSTSRRDRSF